jgi:uncharacterized protein with HEPN domain
MPPRGWRLRIEDILEAIDTIGGYTAGHSSESFAADRKTVEAVAYNAAVIGEAARHIPAAVQARHPKIPWGKMRGMARRASRRG